MNPNTWNKLLDLLHTIIMAPCRTKADAVKLEKQLEDIRREVYVSDEQ